jgi:copper chaperone CopZ
MQNVTLAISGMSCGHCVAAVRAALSDVPGVTVREVGLGSAVITLDPDAATADAALQAVEDAGYAARVVTARASHRPDAAAPGRSLPIA